MVYYVQDKSNKKKEPAQTGIMYLTHQKFKSDSKVKVILSGTCPELASGVEGDLDF